MGTDFSPLLESWESLSNFFSFLCVLYWFLCIGLSVYLAGQKGHDKLLWVTLGISPLITMLVWLPLLQKHFTLMLFGATLFALPVLIAAAGLPKRETTVRIVHENQPIGLGRQDEVESEDPKLTEMMDRLKRKS